MEGGHGDLAPFKRDLQVTINTETEPNVVVEKIKYWNKLDEAYGFLCFPISKDLLFHITILKTPKEIWDKFTSLFDKQDDLQIY